MPSTKDSPEPESLYTYDGLNSISDVHFLLRHGFIMRLHRLWSNVIDISVLCLPSSCSLSCAWESTIFQGVLLVPGYGPSPWDVQHG